jgi:hypothetical protein
MANGHKIWINLNAGTGCIEMTGDLTGVNNIEAINKKDILGVFPCTIQTKPAPPDDQYWIYPFNKMTILTISFRSEYRKELQVELQQVSNQPTWNLGTQAALNQAASDISAFL